MTTERVTRYTVPGEFLVFGKPRGLKKVVDTSANSSVTKIGSAVHLLRTQSESVTAEDLATELKKLVVPNFYITPQNGHSIGGGPASVPMNIRAGVNTAQLNFEIGTGNSALIDQGQAAPRIPVKVYVLDTAPEKPVAESQNADYTPEFFEINDLAAGFTGWDKLKSKVKVARLNRKAHALSTEHMCGANCALHAHGLFIASAIRMIAPNAEVAIIPIFNAKGIGTIASLIEGLEAVRDDPFTGIKIVNCSFTVYVPADAAHAAASANQAHGYGAAQADTAESARIERLRNLLASLTRFRRFIAGQDDDPADDSGVIYSNLFFVAAAGNDGDQNGVPGRRWPARFGDVLPVTAHDGTARAAYANTLKPPHQPADLPGFAVNGKISSIFLSDQQTGALSIADWEGTSFSTAVMSGILSALLTGDRAAAGLPLPAPTTVSEAIFVLKAIADWDDAIDGYVLKVSQQGVP